MEQDHQIPEQLDRVTSEMIDLIKDHIDSNVVRQKPDLYMFVRHTNGVISIFNITGGGVNIEAYNHNLRLHRDRLTIILPYEEIEEVAVAANGEIGNDGLPSRDEIIFHYGRQYLT